VGSRAKAIADSFSGSINESVAEELERRQGQMIEDAAARNAISLSQSIRQDEFEEQLRREHDEEVAALLRVEERQNIMSTNIHRYTKVELRIECREPREKARVLNG
jgi:hypothetical protein